MKYLYLTGTSIILAYLLVNLFVYFYQRNLLYNPSENNYLNDKINFDYQEIFIETDKNIKLKSWFINKDLKRFKTLVFFHGNAGNLLNRVHKLNELSKLDLNILLISWRSFSGNKGKPTEENLYYDAKQIVKWLKTQGLDNKDIILYGESLGTGIVTHIAQKYKFAGVILESPFTSMVDAAKNVYPYFPIRFLLKDKYESDKKVKNITSPILIMHGEADQVVPFWMGKKMYELANEPKYSHFSEKDNHMMEYNKKMIVVLKEYLKSLN